MKRSDIWNRRKPHWICKKCRTLFTVKKPKNCTVCKNKEFIYLASKIEFKRYTELYLLEQAGTIKNLETHPSWSVRLASDVFRIEADFGYEMGGIRRYEDVKSRGTDTGMSRLKRSVLEHILGIRILVVNM